MIDDDLIKEVKSWKMNHFSQTQPLKDAPRLLRNIADTLEKLGDISLVDLLGTTSVEDGVDELTITVYLSFDDPD